MSKQEEVYEALTRLKAEDRDRQKKIQNAENAVAKLQHEKDNPPEHENLQELEAELASTFSLHPSKLADLVVDPCARKA